MFGQAPKHFHENLWHKKEAFNLGSVGQKTGFQGKHYSILSLSQKMPGIPLQRMTQIGISVRKYFEFLPKKDVSVLNNICFSLYKSQEKPALPLY